MKFSVMFVGVYVATAALCSAADMASEPQSAAAQNVSAVAAKKEENKIFNVYTDKKSPDNHYVPSGWMGDVNDVKMDDQAMENPHSGTTSIKVTYSPGTTKNAVGWAGVCWQNPANNWGTKKGGFDLSGMTKLSFWARGEKGGEVVDKFKVGGIGGESSAYPDSCSVEIGPIKLNKEWTEYTVNLAGKDLTYVSGGFSWVTKADFNPQGATFYIDDIQFISDPDLKPQGSVSEKMPFYIYMDRGSIENHFVPSGYMGDYSDIKITEGNVESPNSGNTCIKVVYSPKASQGQRWVALYWQNPANNWGKVDAGYDLSGATKLVFWARGAKGGERIEEFKVGGIMGEFSDSDVAGIGPVLLTPEWKEYTIDLKGKDLSYVIGGFCWSTNLDVNPEGVTFYLDDIKFE